MFHIRGKLLRLFRWNSPMRFYLMLCYVAHADLHLRPHLLIMNEDNLIMSD